MVAAFALALLAGVGLKYQGAQPAWFDDMLAGYAFQYDEAHAPLCVYDSKRGFYLIRDAECDGGIVDLTLTRDRNYVVGLGYKVPNFVDVNGANGNDGSKALRLKKLPSLSTGKGVKIGDNGARVEQLLGRPGKKEHSGSRGQFLNYQYKWIDGKGEDAECYEETYTFKQGKLIEIMFSRSFGAE